MKLADLMEGGVPLIAVSFSDATPDSAIADAESDGLDIAELRIDRYKSLEALYVLDHVTRFSRLPTIATIRTKAEGGAWEGAESDRLELFRAVLPHVDAVDIELSATEILPELVTDAHMQGKVVVVSNHNFDYTPSLADLENMAQRAKQSGADYVKISTMAKTLADIKTLAMFTLRNAELGLIVSAMGNQGSVSRVFFPALGSRITYAHAGGQPLVPGQLEYQDTFNMFRRFYPAFNERKTISMQILEGA